jgi:hypothetical protein
VYSGHPFAVTSVNLLRLRNRLVIISEAIKQSALMKLNLKSTSVMERSSVRMAYGPTKYNLF